MNKIENTLNYIIIRQGKNFGVIGYGKLKQVLEDGLEGDKIEFYKLNEQNYRMN